MKIGILTYHRSHNYGAYLQAYALSHSLHDIFTDAEIEIIDYDTVHSHNEYLIRILKAGRLPGVPYYLQEYRAFQKAQKKLPLSPKHLISNDLNDFVATFKGEYDLIVVGSDQVWVTHGMRGFPNAFWLPGDMGAKKMSYAASSRSELTKLPLYKQELLNTYVNDFLYVGVRDEITRYEIQKFLKTGKKANINPDPVFSWDFGDLRLKGESLLREKFGIKPNEKAMGIMITKITNDQKIIEVAVANGYVPVALYKRQRGARNAVLDPFEWAAVIAALDGLVTSFFHGMCFAIKYDTPFIAFEERKTTLERSKMYDLLSRIDHCELFCSEKDDVEHAIVTSVIENRADFIKVRTYLYKLFLESMQLAKDLVLQGD